MDGNTLYVFLEGNDDKRYFEKILMPEFRKKNKILKFILYAQQSKKFDYIGKFIRSIKSMGCDYIFITDIDNSPCVTAKKQEIMSKLKNIDSGNIVTVIKEIESWYLAGLDDAECRKLKIPAIKTTDDIPKEKFDSLIPSKFNSRIDFMLEILERYSIEVAKRKNKSFKYFIEKFS